MRHILTPAMKLFGKLKFVGKFTVVGLLFLMPIALLLYYFQSEINKGIAFVRLEEAGVAYETPVLSLMDDVIAHQRTVGQMFGSHTATRAEVTDEEVKIESDIHSVDLTDNSLGGQLTATAAWHKLKAEWRGVADASAGSSAKVADAAHVSFENDLLGFIQTVGNNSNLILDPDVDSYYTMDSALTQTPAVAVALSQAADIAANSAHSSSISAANRTQLTVLTGQLSTPLSALQSDVQQVEQFNPSVKATIDPPQSDLVSQANAFLNVIQTGILNSDKIQASEPAIKDAADSTLTALTTYHQAALTTLQALLQKRLDGFLIRRGTVDACVAVSLILCLYFFFALTYATTEALKNVSIRLSELNREGLSSLNLAIEALENGDLSASVSSSAHPLVVSTRDELGEVAETYNAMLESMFSTINSFNKSQQSLSLLIRNLQATAAHVGHSAQSLSATAREAELSSVEISKSVQDISAASEQAALGANEVAKGSNMQADSVSQGAELMQRLTVTVESATEDAERAGQAVDLAVKAAEEGSQTVSQSLTGMNEIRRSVLDSAKVIGQLGESSSQIGTIVSTIEDIAMQTNLLALNAAIEAARVGEAGKGFSVVADEVRKLAERSREAAGEIKDLVEKVQERTEEAIAAMDGGVKEVEFGSVLAQKAGDALTEIRTSVSTVGDRVTGILAATKVIKSTSQEVSLQITDVAAVVEEASAAAMQMSGAVGDVSNSLQQVTDASSRQKGSVAKMAAAANDLATVAQQLEESASHFQIDQGIDEISQDRLSKKRTALAA